MNHSVTVLLKKHIKSSQHFLKSLKRYYTIGNRPLLVKVVVYGNDGGDVHEAKPRPGNESVQGNHVGHVLGEEAQGEPGSSQQPSGYADDPGPKPID